MLVLIEFLTVGGGADGGQQRFDPLNSWPDNANLDKARRLLWPIKQKYGNKLSWADLMVLTGNVAMESMGFKTLGFAGGREDQWETDFVYWGPENKFLANDKRFSKEGKLEKPLAASHMGLIYVNPEGPDGSGDPIAAAARIRETFKRMAMNDEETLALIAGGHTFGKNHGAHKPEDCVGKEPGAASLEEQGFGWKNKCGKGHSEDTITSGLEGAWTPMPNKWTHLYLSTLFNYTWKQTKSPAGAIQWIPTDESAKNLVPDAHLKDKTHAPIMLTTDLALKKDPEYRKIAQRFIDDPEAFDLAFAKAWFKLTHRDLGPRSRYIGSQIPKETMIWQDPLPEVEHKLISSTKQKKLKKDILNSGLTIPELVRVAWASAASFRGSDNRGGANGARIQLLPQKDWEVNNPKEIQKVISKLKEIRNNFNKSQWDGTKISLADIIVLGAAAAIEKAAENAGITSTVPFIPGRVDASQDQTDVNSFAFLEPKADAFRNYYDNERSTLSPTSLMVDKADMLNLSVPEMTVLIGGMRALGANAYNSKLGVLTEKPGVLSNDFFVNLLDMSTKWEKATNSNAIYEGVDRKTGKKKWIASPVDLAFGSNSELRAISEFYASNNSKEKFIEDFIKAWSKVMLLDRFDL